MRVFRLDVVTPTGVVDFVNVSNAYDFKVKVSHGDYCVDGKSLMGLFYICSEGTATVTVDAEGKDIEQFVEQLVGLRSIRISRV